MNALNLARTAYTSSGAPIRTERGVEYDAFARVTHRMKSADPDDDFAQYVNALHENRQLWTVLAVDVADPANALPEPLRAQIFYLAEFTAHHTSQILSTGGGIEPLIDINTSVMHGLRPQAGRQ